MAKRSTQEKKVLVTGGTGFIGSHLVEELLKRNIQVVVPYIEIDNRSYFKKQNLGERVTLIKADITDKDLVKNIIESNSIEFIFHLAAQTIVTTAYKDPYVTINTNVMGTVTLLEAMRENDSVEGIIVASSDKAYGKTIKAYTENSPLKGDHPYDVSKSCADLIAQSYFKTYKLPVVITRFGNVYGAGDLHFDRLIPGICKALVERKELEVRSDGTFVRDYIYVQDVVAGYLLLYDRFEDIHGEAFNFSSDDTLSVVDVISRAENILKKKIPYSIRNTAINEIPYQHLDDSKVRKLGWQPKYPLNSVLVSTCSWYRDLFMDKR